MLLLLSSGCASNPKLTTDQMTANQTRLVPISRTTIPAAIPKQASSITTAREANGSSYQTLQTGSYGGADHSSWFDRFIRDHVPYRSQSASPSPAPLAFNNSADNEKQVLDLVNRERQKAHLPPLTMNSSLTAMAKEKAQEMDSRNYFSHYSPNFGSPFDMMTSFGIPYRTAGENIAQGQSNPSEVMEQWMGSREHRANILNNGYTRIGIGYYNGKWVQEFAG